MAVLPLCRGCKEGGGKQEIVVVAVVIEEEKIEYYKRFCLGLIFKALFYHWVNSSVLSVKLLFENNNVGCIKLMRKQAGLTVNSWGYYVT